MANQLISSNYSSIIQTFCYQINFQRSEIHLKKHNRQYLPISQHILLLLFTLVEITREESKCLIELIIHPLWRHFHLMGYIGLG